ncbi:MAG: hypothetical protein KGI49_03870, partial [Patescibacteria group bacterium]|nr:hypothetical protein [Patescibacteria group bacterium]
MKRIATIFALSVVLMPVASSAQMMGGYYNGTDTGYGPGMMGGYYQNTAPTQSSVSASSSSAMDSEGAAGQALAQKLQAKTVDCSSLTQSDYQSLGEYYMGLMMGSGHDAMDNYVISRYGQSYNDQMHIAMGERFSGCDVNVSFPAGMMGFGPMMGGYGWNGNGYQGGQNSNWSGYGMMGWGFPGMMGSY